MAFLRVLAAVVLAAASFAAQALEVRCAPALPYFCANIHVSCAGRTEHATFSFRLRAEGARASIEAPVAPADIRARYVDAVAERDAEALVLRPRDGRGYIKLRADGRYSFRRYVGDDGIMSYGRCE